MHKLVSISLFSLLVGGCGDGPTEEERRLLASMTIDADTLPPSPTNAVADDERAVELGRRIFFDQRMSADNEVSCASCHEPSEGFSDPRPLSRGVDGRLGKRHSMPITNIAFQGVMFWDGRSDTPWAQSLQAIESIHEMDFTRAEVAHFVVDHHADAYAQIFGPLPDLSAVPARARPGLDAWESMTDTQRDDVQRIFANVGKALEAYQRRLVCADTRFDRWARGEVGFTSSELDGAAVFVRGRCVECHSGPNFSDSAFHNIGLGSSLPEADRGAIDGLRHLLDDLMNGAGPYSDDREAGVSALAALERVPRPLGSFRTPTLRGVAQRQSFGHLGHLRDLEPFIDNVYEQAHMRPSAVGELDPRVEDLDVQGHHVIDFLRTLDCPAPPAELLEPPTP